MEPCAASTKIESMPPSPPAKLGKTPIRTGSLGLRPMWVQYCTKCQGALRRRA